MLAPQTHSQAPVRSEQGPEQLLSFKNWYVCGGRVLSSEDLAWRVKEKASTKPQGLSPSRWMGQPSLTYLEWREEER